MAGLRDHGTNMDMHTNDTHTHRQTTKNAFVFGVSSNTQLNSGAEFSARLFHAQQCYMYFHKSHMWGRTFAVAHFFARALSTPHGVVGEFVRITHHVRQSGHCVFFVLWLSARPSSDSRRWWDVFRPPAGIGTSRFIPATVVTVGRLIDRYMHTCWANDNDATAATTMTTTTSSAIICVRMVCDDSSAGMVCDRHLPLQLCAGV